MPIFLSDLNSEIDNENFIKHRSPPSSVLTTPTKVQISPILSKRKRSNSKKNNSSSSSCNSITSSKDSKISLMHIACVLEKNIHDLDNESDNEVIKELSKKSETNFISNLKNCEDMDIDYKELSVSKTNYGKSEFAENGKRLRQTMLTLKKVDPLIDISKIDSQENLNHKNNSKFIIAQKHCEVINNKYLNQNLRKRKEKDNEFKYSDELYVKKTFKANNDFNNQSNKLKRQNQNMINNNELIATSPPTNESSKLKNKLINKKPKMDETKLPLCSSLKPKLIQRDCFQNKVLEKKCENIENYGTTKIFNFMLNETKNDNDTKGDKRKLCERKTILNDDTFFSPAELRNTSEENIVKIYKNLSTKRILLNSFDEVPDIKEESPDFAYREAPVRKKTCRAQLPGWDCRDCKKWYGNLPEEERKKRQNQCSKHRGKYKADVLTPESFWNPVFDDTHNSSSCDDN